MTDALDAFMSTAERIVYCLGARRKAPGRLGRKPPDPVQARTPAAHAVRVLLYWDPAHDVAVAECEVTWIDDDDGRRDAWGRLSAPPALRLDPWRVQAKKRCRDGGRRAVFGLG